MKKKNFTFLIAFVLLWGALIIWNLFTPTQQFSQAENRTLQQFPSFSMPALLNGKFMQDVDTWLNDQFAGRSTWVSAQSIIEFITGRRVINNVYVGRDALLDDLAPPDSTITADNIAGVSDFSQQYGIPTALALVPGATTVQPQNLPPLGGSWDEIAYLRQIYEQMPEDIVCVSVFEALTAHSEEYIYYRTDHHWTGYGAYLGYTRLAPALGLPIASLSNCAVSLVSVNFRGTYHSRTGYPFITPDSIYSYQNGSAIGYSRYELGKWTDYNSIYFDQYLEVKDQYSYFLGTMPQVGLIRTASESGLRLLVFKDSYAHAILPLLMNDYSEIVLVDLRYLNMDSAMLNQLLDFESFDQALFLYSVDVFSHALVSGKLAEKYSLSVPTASGTSAAPTTAGHVQYTGYLLDAELRRRALLRCA